jgi:mono/diheme cytochrome c family protein
VDGDLHLAALWRRVPTLPYQRPLLAAGNVFPRQFVLHALLIAGLQKSRTHYPVNLNGGADYPASHSTLRFAHLFVLCALRSLCFNLDAAEPLLVNHRGTNWNQKEAPATLKAPHTLPAAPMKRLAIALLPLFTLALSAIVRGQEARGLEGQVRPFVAAYCIDCHGPDEQTAGLRLDTLPVNLADPDNLAKWVLIHDKLAAGQMPPPDSHRPPKPDLKKFVTLLHASLHAASLARQHAQGRVLVRRLNATQYENSIRELVGTNVRVKEMLPEENSVAGFDNVGSALDFSATHLLLYQEAAEKAVRSAVPQYPVYPIKERRLGKDFQRGPNFRQALGRSCKLEGDSAILYSKMGRYGLCQTNAVAGAGTYRVRMSVSAVGDQQKPIPAGFFILENTGRDDPVLFDCRDIPHGEPQVIELDVELARRQAFVINLLTTWDIRDFKRPLDEYTGPGLRIDWLEIEGPIGPFPPQSYTNLFAGVPLEARSVAKAKREGSRARSVATRRSPDNWLTDPLEPASENPLADAERLIRAFLPRAFRGPVPEELAKQYVAGVQQKLKEQYSFFDAMLYGYKSILSAPHFLLLTEPALASTKGKENLRSTTLDDYALANRLSYFLWSGPPDDELLAAAARGEITSPDQLHSHVERLLNDPRAHHFTENFTGQWLDLRKIDATIPDPRLYGDFDGVLLWSMPRESHLVFNEILKHDRSLLEFVAADWSMLNARLAKHYGIPGVEGNEFRKVALPEESHRGGVLTQAAVLKVTADGTRTSPVLRGKWVLEKILGQPPAPPPPDVPAIEPDIRGATTIRQQLAQHRAIASCASCHVHIDPPGFALEAFDPIGGYRDFYRSTSGDRKSILPVSFRGRPIYRGPDVEPGGQTHDGQTFADIDDYKQLLLRDKDQLARNLTEKLLIYSTGGDIQFADREVVEQIVADIRQQNYGFRTLIHQIVQSRIFLNK